MSFEQMPDEYRDQIIEQLNLAPYRGTAHGMSILKRHFIRDNVPMGVEMRWFYRGPAPRFARFFKYLADLFMRLAGYEEVPK